MTDDIQYEWENILDQKSGFVHVCPINDIEEHLLEVSGCKCLPKIDVGGQDGHKYKIVIHNAFDKRNELEEISIKEWRR